MRSIAGIQTTPSQVLELAHESLYVGVDIGKRTHVAGCISTTLLARHRRFEACPALRFDNSREGFRTLIDWICRYVPLEQCAVLMEKTGHYHKALEQYLQDLDITVYLMAVQERPRSRDYVPHPDQFRTVLPAAAWPRASEPLAHQVPAVVVARRSLADYDQLWQQGGS